MDDKLKQKCYNNRAKVIFSLRAFPPLNVYAILRSTAFTPKQKWLVVLAGTAVIALLVVSGAGAKINNFILALFT